MAKLAAGQWGVVTMAQLVACGMTRREVEVRVRQGHLHPLYRGVYAVGHPNIALEGRFVAAVLACGPQAVLSHDSAAALHDLVRWDGRPFDVSAPTKRKHPRIKAHRPTTIERTVVKGIPVTPKLRTVIDLALDLGAVATRSPLEDRVYDFVVRSRLERPLSNPPYRLPNRIVYPDLYWPHLRLVVEVATRGACSRASERRA